MKPERICTSNDRIKELIDDMRMSQIEFCNITGIKASALSNYINGSRVPRQDAIMKIADAFDISASWLMGYDVPAKITDRTTIGHFLDDKNALRGIEIYDTPERLRLYSKLIKVAEPFDDEQIERFIEALAAFNVPKRRKKDPDDI